MKLFKKVTSLLLVCTAAAATFLALTAESCSESAPAAHTHDWGDWTVTTEATCEAAGVKTRTCKLDATHVETEEIPATGHTYGEWAVTTPATCTTDGVKTKNCACGDTQTEAIPATGHEYDTEFTVDNAATCTAVGSKSKHCKNCDSKTEVTEIPATGHTYGEWVVATPATCTADGVKTKTCVCGDTQTEAIPATGHDYDTEFTVDNAATCTAVGSKSKHCKNCDSKTEVTEIPATGHTYGEWAITTPATCTADGVKTKTCACGDTQTEAIPATGHDYDTEFTVDNAATCTAVGSKSKHCKNCDEKTETTEIPATGHSMQYVKTDPSGSNKGVITATCEACKASISEEFDVLSTNLLDTVVGGKSYLLYAKNTGNVDSTYACGITRVPLNIGVYEFNFKYLDYKVHALNISRGATLENKYRIFKNATTVNDTYKNNITVEFKNGNLAKITINVDGTVIPENALLVMQVALPLIPQESGYLVIDAKYTPPVEVPKIKEGGNSIQVTVANSATDTDSYGFTPTETKTYSMTVPAGVYATIDGVSFIDASESAAPVTKNFDATAGRMITFSFGSAKVGSYTVNIGDKVMPSISTAETYTVSTYPAYNSGETVSVAAGVEEGDYTFTFEGGAGMGRCSFYFILNWDGTSTSGNESTGWYYISANCSFKVILHCKAGDTLTLFNPARGTGPSVIISMEKAQTA